MGAFLTRRPDADVSGSVAHIGGVCLPSILARPNLFLFRSMNQQSDEK
jgi:hypothetical protein